MSARRDIAVLFLTRTVRLTAYGTIGVILALYLSAIGLGNDQLGILLTLTLLGDSVISLAVTRWADRIGRRFMLISSCLLMVLSGLVYGEVSHPSFALLLVAATIGVLSPSGNEVGPFMALEQSILSELVTPQNRTHVFAWYNLVGYSATALGALAAGGALTWAQRVYGISELEGYRAVFLQYGIIGGMLLVLFMLLTEQVERPERRTRSCLETGKAVAGAAVAVTATAAVFGRGCTAFTAVERDEEAGLQEPLLAPAIPEERPATPPLPLEDVEEEASASAAQHAVESFPLMLDDVTEGSERYGSEIDGGGYGCTPPRRTASSMLSLPPEPDAADGESGESGDEGNGSGEEAGRGCDAGEVVLGIGLTGKSSGGGGGAAAADRGDRSEGGAGRALGLSVRSQRIVVHLSVLFAADSFAGGLLTGTLLAYYFQTKYGVSTAYLGSLLFGANLLAAVSSLLSGYVAARIGLINTMVFTHLPSNILMLLVPLMPNLRLAALMVFLRFSISQMDVAPRASYVAGVVRPDERTAAMGIVNIAKSIGAAFGPLLTGWLAERGLFHWSFYLCGGLKILYDLALLWSFAHVKPEH